MNKRLIELLGQCTSNQMVMTHEVDLEKFATLIVQECLDIISPYVLRMENHDGGHPISDIKKQFGVK